MPRGSFTNESGRSKTRTGIDEANIWVMSSVAYTEHFNPRAAAAEDLAYLRSLPGVLAASQTDSIPFSNTGNSTDLWTNPAQQGAARSFNAIAIDERGLDALGVRLVAGRNFRSDEILPALTETNMTEFVPEVIITRAVAESLFPRENALGKNVFDGAGSPASIVGIVENFIGTAVSEVRRPDWVMLIPRAPPPDEMIYLVRTRAGSGDATLLAAETHLASSNPDRILKFVRPLQSYKNRYLMADTNMAVFLVTTIALVVLTTGVGIFGLANFNVSTRTRQIGIRRALGARKRDIWRSFMQENGLLTAIGIVIGAILGLLASEQLFRLNQLPRLSGWYLLGGAVLLVGIGQLATWLPARKAANQSPSVATRSG